MNLWAGNETLKPEALETERQEQNCCHLQLKIFMTPSHPEDLQAEHCQSYSPFLGGGEGVTDHSQAICWEIFFFLVFINLAALGLSCGMWNLFYQPQIELGPPTLEAWSLSHWTTGEVPAEMFKPW